MKEGVANDRRKSMFAKGDSKPSSVSEEISAF
jgi:hypothetical protein